MIALKEPLGISYIDSSSTLDQDSTGSVDEWLPLSKQALDKMKNVLGKYQLVISSCKKELNGLLQSQVIWDPYRAGIQKCVAEICLESKEIWLA
ncbi:hypothetical protein KFK09_026695 [Dendrobium nobile]|uniref:Uncharacterized protein n=1 Tax=Dendrobium nobile TaxID=94219 RepID=A0A8T3A8K2_DENNO|nr:hypothetical protein KFK09_026695 [Dendrobium nobile]